MLDTIIKGVPLIIVVLALVQFTKELGASGKLLLVISLLIGMLFGVAVAISAGMPTTFAGWFEAIVVGLVWGLSACGLFDAGKQFAKLASGK